MLCAVQNCLYICYRHGSESERLPNAESGTVEQEGPGGGGRGESQLITEYLPGTVPAPFWKFVMKFGTSEHHKTLPVEE